ncbi:MAG: M23 family metallopeptidase [Nannocystis sp.]|uniref:M23 family metallopeptidase n=1 Tax=Nannocystis sp. TaxID=1962667 RepID=UPI0024289751|nr:M23 family metallopeptidase [Nannocystis sp.]MBK9755917.1 M23 family metallopeptidase [Nannocystis sp.]
MRLALLAALALACNATDEPGDTIADSTGELAPEAFWLPLACGATSRVGQGNDNPFSHHDELRFAFDLLLVRGSPVHAMADGIVTHVKNDVRPGDPCRDGGDERCRDHANLVVLLHDDGTSTLYKHLDDALATVGNRLARGALLGRSGTTGWSTTPHLHVMRMDPCAAIECPSIALAFVDVPGDGVPVTGQDLKSMNCPE